MACDRNPRALADFRPSGRGRPCRLRTLVFFLELVNLLSPNDADGASVRGARLRLLQEHHQHKWDLILGRFQ